MTRALRQNAMALAFAALGLGSLAWLGLIGFAWSDYDVEASAAVKALGAGHVSQFAALAPAYGGSLVLRAPFVVVSHGLGGGELSDYRMLALPCLLALGVLGVWMVHRMRGLGHSRLARGLALGLCVASPIACRALELGHPEEILVAALCVAAMLAAVGRHGLWAAVLLGLAIGSKSWALVAVAPVIAALGAHRWRALVVTAAVATLLVAPLAVGHLGRLGQTGRAAATTGTIFQPWQAWWFLGAHGKVVRGLDGQVKPGYRAAPAGLGSIPRVLIVLLPIPLTLLWLRRRRGARAPNTDALLLLALVLTLRCLLDPWNTMYYALPALLSLLAWEALGRRGLPVTTLLVTAVLWLVFAELPGRIDADGQAAAYLIAAVPFAGGLALRLYAPALARRFSPASGRRLGRDLAVRRSRLAGGAPAR